MEFRSQVRGVSPSLSSASRSLMVTKWLQPHTPQGGARTGPRVQGQHPHRGARSSPTLIPELLELLGRCRSGTGWAILMLIPGVREGPPPPDTTGQRGGGMASPGDGLEDGLWEERRMAVEGQPLRSPPGFHVRCWSGACEPPTQPPAPQGRPLGPCQSSHVPPTNLGIPPGKVKWGPQRPLMNSV